MEGTLLYSALLERWQAERDSPDLLPLRDSFLQSIRDYVEQVLGQSREENIPALQRQLFETELGRPPRHFAFPWMLGSAFSLEAATETGIESVFGVGLDFRRIRGLNSPVQAYGRIKGDWLRFLPGRGRLPLSKVISWKIRRFLYTQHLAH